MAKKSKAASDTRTESAGVNFAEIERLLTFMQLHGLEEFEYQHGELHVRLKKAPAAGNMLPRFRPENFLAPAATAPAVPSAPPDHAENVHIIKSPIVGTFYAAPSPEAEPFVTLGASVEAGEVLCIIEAMKLMNEIESDVAGEVVRIHVENGKPVEYGAPLFDIRVRSQKN
jgi:acetyl-CoA carboxylase biotin carboxyl carrier protein